MIYIFIWDFAAGFLLDQIIDWVYDQVIGIVGVFLSAMGLMGAELFDLPPIMALVQFFVLFSWALYVVGMVVAVFECAIEYQSGRGSVKDVALNAIKGFMATSLFSIIPVELYKLCITLTGTFAVDISGLGGGIGSLTESIVDSISSGDFILSAGFTSSVLFQLIFLILIIYCVVKVFFANLKRGGILLIQIAVGSLYMFSVPRGYLDGFLSWTKQVIGLCVTAFMQTVMLTLGLMVAKEHPLMGIGLMMASNEVQRIAGAFGLDTSTKASLGNAIQTASSSISLGKTITQVVAK